MIKISDKVSIEFIIFFNAPVLIISIRNDSGIIDTRTLYVNEVSHGNRTWNFVAKMDLSEMDAAKILSIAKRYEANLAFA